MNPVVTLREIDEKREREASIDTEAAEKQVRISLAAAWPRAVKLSWMTGKGSKPSTILLQPGRAIVQPLPKAQVWFGPFGAFEEYAQCTDEKRREKLAEFIREETRRYLNTWDYPRKSFREPDPAGPHRSPDVTVTILEADGEEHPPIRLYRIYEIGEFDPLATTFGPQVTVEEVKAKYEAELSRLGNEHKIEMQALALQMAELKGNLDVILNASRKPAVAAGAK